MHSHNFVWAAASSLFAATTHAAAASSNTTVGSFYAYGTNISGLPVFYVDATAYIGLTAPAAADTATNVTFHEISSTSAIGSSLSVTANETNAVSEPLFYINSAAASFDAAGFTTPANDSVDISTTDFVLFGSELMWISSSGTLQEHWWAMPADGDGLWTLTWDSAGTGSDVGVPVVIKNTAPTVIGSSPTV